MGTLPIERLAGMRLIMMRHRGLGDEDVVQMVRVKTGGGDPAELVRQKIEDFRLGI